MEAVSWFDSELAGPQQDVPRTRCGGERDPAAEAQVLLLRPERGLAGPCPAKPAVCSGKQTTCRQPAASLAGSYSPTCSLVCDTVHRTCQRLEFCVCAHVEGSALRKRLWSLFCTRLSHQLSLAVLSDLKSVHKRRSATHPVCLFLAALLPLTACLGFCIYFFCPPFPSHPLHLTPLPLHLPHILTQLCTSPPCYPWNRLEHGARHGVLSTHSYFLSQQQTHPCPHLSFFHPVLISLSVLQTVVGAHEDNGDSLHKSASDLSLVKG